MKNCRKLIALLMAFILVVSMLPVYALADNGAHTHSEACYTVSNTLICELEESEEHSHTDACYKQTSALTCGLEESEIPATVESGSEQPDTPENADGQPAQPENSAPAQNGAPANSDAEVLPVLFSCEQEGIQIAVYSSGTLIEGSGMSYLLPAGHYEWKAFSADGTQCASGEFDVDGEGQTITVIPEVTVDGSSLNEDNKDTFVIGRVPGGTQKDAIVNGEHRVIFCMQYDYLWPITEEGYHNPQTNYWEASPEEFLLDPVTQLPIIRKVLFAGYPYDAVGALAPLYNEMGSYAADTAADLTQALIWSLMAEWGVPGNTHYEPIDLDHIDDPAWKQAYINLRDYATTGTPLSDAPADFVPQLIGDATLIKNHGSWTTAALSITNPEGFKLKYSVTLPDGVVLLDADGSELMADWEFVDGDWKNMGYTIYGGDTFYLQTEDADYVNEGDLITINGAVMLPTSISQYMTKDTGMGDKGDGQGHSEHNFQTMLSVGISTTKYHSDYPIYVAGETVTITGHKTWVHGDNPESARPTSINVHLHANGALLQNITVTPDADGNWNYSFENLPKYDHNGALINYTVDEGYVHDYSASYHGYNITNTYTPEKTSINVEKSWVGDQNHDGLRPSSITVKLLADGVDTGKTLTLTDINGWRGEFEDLDEKVDDGTEGGRSIVYTVEEVSVPGYTSETVTQTDSEGRTIGFVITNTHTAEHVDIKGEKIWDDNDDAAGARPQSITVILHADGVEKERRVVTEQDGWMWNFTDLPEFNHGEKIIYTVTELRVTNYTTSYDRDSYNITNTYAPSKISIPISKAWHDANNQDGIRPATVTVHLLANQKLFKTLTLDESGNWEGVFADLDEFDKDGKEITYTITEDTVDGYVKYISGNPTVGFVVNNTHAPATVSVSGEKTWIDSNNQDGKRPDSIVVKLLADGVPTDEKTVTAANNWKWFFIDLPKYHQGKEIVYTVLEDRVDDYSTTYSGYNITNSYTPAKTSVTVMKRWEDANNQDGKRPDEIKVKLLADGADTGKTVTLNDANRWEGSFTNLDEYKDGTEIVYTVKEAMTDDTASIYSSVISGDEDSGFIITNSYTPETTSVSGSKTWNHGDYPVELHPTSITVRLHSNGAETAHKVVTPDADGNWTWTFTDLPKMENGKEIVYTVTEDGIEEYNTQYTLNSFDITNTYIPGKVSISVSKAWDDTNNQDGIRTGSVTVQLYADDQPVSGKTLVLDDENNWRGSFTDLDEYKDGAKIVYTVKEVDIPDGYTASVAGDPVIGYTVTNHHTTEKINLHGSKDWDDSDDLDGLRPSSVIINILADGEKIDSITLRESTHWKWSVSGLPKFKDGKEIKYTVTEDEVPGYEAEVTGNAASGFTVTNKHKATLCGILTVTKTVKGTGASYDKEFEFTVTLTDAIGKTINGTYGDMTFVDGVATFKLRHGESASAIGLPAGIKYTVTEARAVGYTKTSAGASGTILGGKTVTAKFVNTRNNGSFGPIPGTGDFNQPITWILLILIAAVIMAVTIFTGKRRRTARKNNR